MKRITVDQIVEIIRLALGEKDEKAKEARETLFALIRSGKASDADMAGMHSREADAVFSGVASVARAVHDMIESEADVSQKEVCNMIWDMHCKACRKAEKAFEDATYWKGSLNMHAYITASSVQDMLSRLYWAENEGISHVYNAILYADTIIGGGDPDEDMDEDELAVLASYAAALGL